jgi:hypothetical protein
MKKAVWLFIFLLADLPSGGQNISEISGSDGTPEAPKLFIGLSSGLNNPGGSAGIFGEVFTGRHISISGSGGISPWGYKLTGGLYYYQYAPFGTYFNIGFSYLSGLDSKVFGLQVEGMDSLTNVNFNLKPGYCINLIIGYQHKIWEETRIHLEIGYAIPLQHKPYILKSSGIKLTDYSDQIMGLLEPGGILIDAGFSVGF